jgi:glutamate 5-kinase
MGSSLLPIGVLGVEGEFSRGEVVLIKDMQGQEVARGLSNYAAAEAEAVAAKSLQVNLNAYWATQESQRWFIGTIWFWREFRRYSLVT